MDTKLVQNIWITGAGSGIGRALALQLAREGHRIYASGRSREKLEKLAEHYPDNIFPLPCNVSDDGEMQELFPSMAVPPPYLDVVIAAAGQCEYIDLPDLDIDLMRRVFDANLFGVVNTCAAAIPLLTASPQRPQIVGICSMSCYRGFPRAEAYGASKAAMSYFLESLRSDIQDKIDTCIVYPGFVDTPMTVKNDFPMPVKVSAEYAATLIRKKMRKRKHTIAFPYRMHWLLKLAGFSQAVWFGLITPRISRAGKALRGCKQ